MKQFGTVIGWAAVIVLGSALAGAAPEGSAKAPAKEGRAKAPEKAVETEAVEAGAVEAEAVKAPKIACDEPTFDFGKVDTSTDVKHTFVVRNDGNADLNIIKVKPACGCTLANLSTKIVPPGGTAEITTKLSMRNRNGKQRKGITVTSDDPNNAKMMLYLVGEGVSDIAVAPSRIFFGHIDGEVHATNDVKVTIAKPELAFSITGIESTSEHFEASFESSENKLSHTIRIATKPTMPEGSLKGTVKATTDSKIKPTINIPVTARIVGDVVLIPEEIVLVSQKGDTKPVTRYLIVKPGSDKTLVVKDVKMPEEGNEATTRKVGTGYQIKLTGLTPSKELSGKKIIVTTDLKGHETIEVPIRVTFR